VMKVHHSVTDGIGGIDLLSQMVDTERDAHELAALLEPPAPEPSTPPHCSATRSATPRAVGSVSPGASRDARRAALAGARDPLRAAADAVDTARSIGRMLAPATAPLSPVLLTRGLGRRLDTLEVPLDDLKRAAKAVDGSLNDAFVAAVVGGLSRYHDRHGVAVSELRMTLPINLRTTEHGSAGNQFAPVRFPVPAAIIDPAARMKAIGVLVRSWRAEPALASPRRSRAC